MNTTNTKPPAGSSLQAQGTRRCYRPAVSGCRFIPAGAGNTTAPSILFSAVAVHPCRRREHPARFRQALLRSGSSLQAQGTLVAGEVYKRVNRFIPAGAGNTKPRALSAPSRAVHPCRRREHAGSEGHGLRPPGSSLQAQGTLEFPGAKWQIKRFIPAGAGNTFTDATRRDLGAVHPCRRREHFVQLWRVFVVFGSSLQAQGTHLNESYQLFA